ncbi:MAG: GTP 3',8-cyclase MoaA [Aureliella sp.]
MVPGTLTDRFGRKHRSLRVSVTDVCNIRCQYCMPADSAEFMPQETQLSFEAIERFVRWVAVAGVNRVRLTGGEPLLRKGLASLVHRLAAINELETLALTTNGMLLRGQVDELAEAGLQKINISLDTLSEDVFERISRRKGLDQVLDGIESALQHPGLEVKLNALVLRDVNLDGIHQLVEFAVERQLTLRFIEFMPLDAERAWSQGRMVSGEELREHIQSQFGELVPVQNQEPTRPSRDYRFVDNRGGLLGFIDSVSNPFCGACDRIRLTADGKLRNCLFGTEEWNVAELISGEEFGSVQSAELAKTLQACISAKHAAHGIANSDFEQPERPMYQIGG